MPHHAGRAVCWILLSSVVASVAAAQTPSATKVAGSGTFDLVLANGRVIDPETGLDGVRSVGIRDGRIAAISRTPLQGRTVLDARGLVVAPGFIDLHAHGQDLPAARMQAFDGVTTALELEGRHAAGLGRVRPRGTGGPADQLRLFGVVAVCADRGEGGDGAHRRRDLLSGGAAPHGVAAHPRVVRRDLAHHRPRGTGTPGGRARDRRPCRLRAELRPQGGLRRSAACGASWRADVHTRALHERDRTAVVVRGDCGDRVPGCRDRGADAHRPPEQHEHPRHPAHCRVVARRPGPRAERHNRGVSVRAGSTVVGAELFPRQLAGTARRRHRQRHRAGGRPLHRRDAGRGAGQGAGRPRSSPTSCGPIAIPRTRPSSTSRC